MSLIHQQLSVNRPVPIPAPPPAPHQLDLHPHTTVEAQSISNIVKPAAQIHRHVITKLTCIAIGMIVAIYLYGTLNNDSTSQPSIQQPVLTQTITKEAALIPPVIEAPIISQPETIAEDIAPALHVAITLPGARVQTKGQTTTIIFEKGIFSRGTQLTDEAQQLLIALGQQLIPYDDNISIQVTGHTDNDPVPPNREYKTNHELGMLRATSVANFIIANTTLPAELFALESMGELNAPYPNDSVSDRIRNRTATISLVTANP